MIRHQTAVNQRKRYKMLPLAFPFNRDAEFWEECVNEAATPVLRRNGWFLDRYSGYTWLEINGKAFRYADKEHFLFALATHDGENWLDKDVVAALSVLVKHRMATKRQQALYYHHCCRLLGRATYREASLASYKMCKEIRDAVETFPVK